MKNSLYKIVTFFFLVVIFILLVILCIHLDAFSFAKSIDWSTPLLALLNNSYVVNIISSILGVILLYIVQVSYCKYKIKKDFRCSEIIEDLHDAIQKTFELICLTENIHVDGASDSNYGSVEKDYYHFYIKNQRTIEMCNSMLVYENHDILLDSVQSVFFINLNFELLNIVNNIKNRKPNLVNGPAEIAELCLAYHSSNSEDDMIRCGRKMRSYLVDLKFMATYYLNLLNYLNYDPIPTKLYVSAFRKRYPTSQQLLQFLSLPSSERLKVEKQVRKELRKSILSHHAKTFFKRDK